MVSTDARDAPVPRRRKPRFVLQEGGDISRVMGHLVTHWNIPSLDIRIDRLHKLDSQRAQDTFVRLAERCNCFLGVAAAGTTLLYGGYALWVAMGWWSPRGGWRDMVAIAIYALIAGLIGKAAELAWTRLRMLMVLWKLKQRHAAATAGRLVQKASAPPELIAYAPLRKRDDAEVHEDRAPPRARPGSARARVILSESEDASRIARGLLLHRRLPRVVIQNDALPKLTVQHAQERFARLLHSHTLLLPAILATATFLAGFAKMVWLPRESVLWTMTPDMHAVGRVFALALGAALAGAVIQVIWVRVQFIGLLLDLRREFAARKQPR